MESKDGNIIHFLSRYALANRGDVGKEDPNARLFDSDTAFIYNVANNHTTINSRAPQIPVPCLLPSVYAPCPRFLVSMHPMLAALLFPHSSWEISEADIRTLYTSSHSLND